MCAKKLPVFQEHLEIDATAQEALHNRKKLQSLCETRWASRAEALNTFKAAFTTVVSAVEQLAADEGNGERTKSYSYLHAIERFDFTIALCTAKTCKQALLPLSKQLQEKNCDLVQAAGEVAVVKELLQGWRNDPETTTLEEIFRAAVGTIYCAIQIARYACKYGDHVA